MKYQFYIKGNEVGVIFKKQHNMYKLVADFYIDNREPIYETYTGSSHEYTVQEFKSYCILIDAKFKYQTSSMDEMKVYIITEYPQIIL